MMKYAFKFLVVVWTICLLSSIQYVYAEASVGQDVPGKISYRFSLDETTRFALQNNFDIQLAKYDAWIARTDQDVSESIYDTIFNAEVKYRNNKKKIVSTIPGTKELDNDYNIALSKKLNFGTTLSVALQNNRNWTDSAFAVSPLTHDSVLGVKLEQELGKNFFGLKDRGTIKITRLNIENAEYTSLEKIEENLAQVQKAYWDLVLEVDREKIEKEMVEQARRLYELHEEKLKDNLIEKPEVLATLANFKRRTNDLRIVRNRVHKKMNALKFLCNIPEDEITFEPTDFFNISDEQVQVNQALKQAFDSRRDYKKAHNDIKNRNIHLSMKKNDLWPEINLTASLDRNGLGDHFDQSIVNTIDENNPNFFVGVVVTMPLGNREAKGQLKASELEKAKALINLKLIERKMSVEIVDQTRDCNTFQDAAIHSVEIAALQEQKFAEEEKRFDRGRSDTDTLIRFQEDVIQDRLRAAQAKHRYHSSIVELEKRKGTLLNKYWTGVL